MIDNIKSSLDNTLRQKAYEEVKEMLANQDIDIDKVAQEDVEALVNEKVQIMQSELKGVGIGVGLGILVSMFGF